MSIDIILNKCLRFLSRLHSCQMCELGSSREPDNISKFLDCLKLDEYEIAVNFIIQNRICDLSPSLTSDDYDEKFERQNIVLRAFLKHKHENKIIMYWWMYAAKDSASFFNVTTFILNHPETFSKIYSEVQEKTQKQHVLCIQELKSHRNVICNLVRSCLDSSVSKLCTYWDTNICSIINKYVCFENSQKDWFAKKFRDKSSFLKLLGRGGRGRGNGRGGRNQRYDDPDEHDTPDFIQDLFSPLGP